MYLQAIKIRESDFPTHGYYPFDTPAICGTAELQFNSPVCFFVGENGSGKSTLLEAMARNCGVHLWDKPRRHLAHNNPYEHLLKNYLTTSWFNGRVAGSHFRAETFNQLADFLDDVALCDPGRLEYHGGRILNNLSHGEGILSYFGGRFRIKGLYFLDEPEAALSPASQIEFLQLLQCYSAGGQAQFIIATHSPILMACPNAQIYHFGERGIRPIVYEETSHYQIYQRFFSDRAQFLRARE